MSDKSKESKNNFYDHNAIELKWRDTWLKDDIYKTPEINEGDEKYYSLYSFPYPSGAGLHVGHAEGMVANDIMARFYRMKGRKVTLPMGWDSFGLPAENYAIKTGVHPRESTEEAITTFIDQIKKLGISVDWDTEVGAHRPDYYKWTQWFFSQLYKHGLAYKAKAPVNWCPKDQTVLANEQVVDGKCERCDTPVEKKELDQWFFKITDYAERLVDDLEGVDWPDSTKHQQRNWIGRSEGIEITYDIEGLDEKVTVFTSYPETNYGATFVVLAYENPLVDKIVADEYKQQVEKYRVEKSKETQEEREHSREKSGVFTGRYAINKLTGRKMPIYVTDFVLMTVGTGAVVGVPGHDERDFEFAKAMGSIDIVRVMYDKSTDEKGPIDSLEKVQHDNGTMTNSDILDGMDQYEAREKIKDKYVEMGDGKRVVNYRLRDWLISRQRYWGAPIPAIWRERRKADKALLIHGIFGTGNNNWFPWLKNELIDNYNIQTTNPDFPNTERPLLSEWINKIDQEKLTANSSIIAHSLGCFAALKYAENNKVKQLVMVAPTNTGDKKYWDQQRKLEPDFPVDHVLANVYNEELDPEKIAKNVEEIVFIFSSNDPYITEPIREQFQKQFGKFKNVEFKNLLNKHHFGTRSGIKELHEVTEYFGEKQYKVLDTEDLPMLLPDDVDFIPKGYSPLSRSKEYSDNVKNKFGQEWTPEFDTMDTFVCSSWYFFRYIDSRNEKEFADPAKLNAWLPVDLYMIGAEHIVLHLMYARFFTKFLYDLGIIKFTEPFYKMRHMGIIAGPDGRKMSKRWGNVINPNDVVEQYGADTLRVYEMFMGPLDQGKAWNDSSVQGVRRFLERVYNYSTKVNETDSKSEDQSVKVAINRLIKDVTEDTENLKFNTAVSAFMKFMNEIEKTTITKSTWLEFIKLLSVYAPYITEEIWQNTFGQKGSIHKQSWPSFDNQLLASQEIEIAVQFNGKTRGTIKVNPADNQEEVHKKVMKDEKLATYFTSDPKKVIFVQNRIINFLI